MPLAPIAAQSAFGLTNIFRLRTAWVTAEATPDAGRFIEFSSEQVSNLLRVDTGLLAHAPEATADGSWNNYGGDWLWPVAQQRWPTLQQGDWPPPPLFRNAAWHGQAWENVDGSKCCLLTQELGEPVNVRVTRLLRVDRPHAQIDIRQRITRTAASKVPVCLWQISQVAGAQRVILATDPASAFSNGYRVLGFDAPPANIISHADGATVFDVSRGTEHKVGSDSARAWVAAQKGTSLMVESVTAGDESHGVLPDGGCRTEFYANRGLGYAEIESLSIERLLEPGERLENTVHVQLYTVATNLTPTELVQKIRAWRGEVPAEAANKL